MSTSPPEQKPDPEVAASQKRVEQRLAKQDARLEAKERAEKRRISATKNLRRVGGLRMLLANRDNSAAGLLTHFLGSAQTDSRRDVHHL